MGNASSTKPNRRLWSRLLAFLGLLLASAWAVGAMRGGRVNPFVTPPPRFAAALQHSRGSQAPLKGIFANVARPRSKRGAEDEAASGSDLPWDQFLPRSAEIGDEQYAALYLDSWPSLFERRGWKPLPGSGSGGGRAGAGTFDAEPLLAAASLRSSGTGAAGSSSGGSGGGSSGGGSGGASSGGITSSGGSARPDPGGTTPPGQVEIPTPVVPEPATWLVMIVGFATVGLALRLRRTTSRRPTLH